VPPAAQRKSVRPPGSHELARLQNQSVRLHVRRRMGRYEELTKHIPWSSMGSETVAARVRRSIVPVGMVPDALSAPAGTGAIRLNETNAEQFLINIVGTGIQAARAKLVTCAHVVSALPKSGNPPCILARCDRDSHTFFVAYPIQVSINYVDPRINAANPNVDVAVLLVNAKSTPELPYQVTPVEWGDSTEVGVGDPVVIAGFPYGRDMFLLTQSNRGVVQPTFYSGIISAVIPVVNSGETRLFQLSIPAAGGMSGGAVFQPDTGKVIGMVTSCVYIGNIPQPISWAVPSEVIAPFVEVITFTSGGE